MKNFKAKIASIHEDLELRKSLEIEEDKNIKFENPNASMVNSVLEAVYTSIKNTIKTFDREWYNKNTDADPVNDLMAAFKQAADLIESRYTGGDRTTFFNAAEDRNAASEDIIRGTLQIKGDRMDIGIHDATITVHGVDTPTNPMARIRAYLEMALAHILGYPVDAPGSVEGSQFKPLHPDPSKPEHTGENPPKVGDYTVSVLWADKTGYDSDQFKLVPKRG